MTPLKTMLLKTLILTANEQGLDPALMAGIVSVESKFKPHATGTIGERGLFQLHPKYFPGDEHYNACKNIQVGVESLKRLKQRCQEFLNQAPNLWVICHNRGVTGAKRMKDPLNDEYYKKVTEATARYRRIIQSSYDVGETVFKSSKDTSAIHQNSACGNITR